MLPNLPLFEQYVLKGSSGGENSAIQLHVDMVDGGAIV